MVNIDAHQMYKGAPTPDCQQEALVKIKIDGYLSQKKLETALSEIVGGDAWRGRELSVPGSSRRWDMAYEIDGLTTVVEYDGDAHYCNSLKAKVDAEKDAAAVGLGYRVVRFPYWIQLTTETLKHYFDLNADVEQVFPQGFVTTKIFPASYSELGIERFACELASLPVQTRTAVEASLRDRAAEHGAQYVLPTKLRHLL
jgi:hypothetical protein